MPTANKNRHGYQINPKNLDFVVPVALNSDRYSIIDTNARVIYVLSNSKRYLHWLLLLVMLWMLMIDVIMSVIIRWKCPSISMSEFGRCIYCCCNGWGLERSLLIWHGILPFFSIMNRIHFDCIK